MYPSITPPIGNILKNTVSVVSHTVMLASQQNDPKWKKPTQRLHSLDGLKFHRDCFNMSTIQHGPSIIKTVDGEEYSVEKTVAYIAPIKTLHPYRRFFTMNTNAVKEILDADTLTDKEKLLFVRLSTIMGVGNAMHINQTKMAEEINIPRETLNRMLKKLVAANLLSKEKDGQLITWTINPEYVWNGQRKILNRVMQEKRAESLRKKFKVIQNPSKLEEAPKIEKITDVDVPF